MAEKHEFKHKQNGQKSLMCEKLHAQKLPLLQYIGLAVDTAIFHTDSFHQRNLSHSVFKLWCSGLTDLLPCKYGHASRQN